MNTAARGARRKPAAVRGKRPGSSSSRTGMTRSAADVSGYTAANNRQTENSKSQISVKDVQEEHREVADMKEKPNGSADYLDNELEQTMNTVNSAEETHDEVTEESNDIEDVLQSAVLQSVEINMDISEDESGDCILEDVLLIDSVDGADAETSPTIETENDSKPVVVDEDDMVEFLKSLGMKGAVGFLELSITGVPLLHIVAAETQEVRHRRKVVVHLVKPSDFNGPILQGIINSEQCIHLRMECDRPLNDVDSWTGELELYFGSASAASSAAETLYQMREGIEVDYGQPAPVIDNSTAEQNKMLEEEMKPWIDLILIVKNLGSTTESCKEKLAEMFPDADIAFRKDSSSEHLRGQAYLVFGNKQQVEEAIKNFKSKRTRLDDRRLILIRWNPKRALPSGMLRIGERRLVMLTMLQMESRLAKGDDPSLSAKYKALGNIVARDTKARHACGIPAPSYNQLKGLHDVRHYSDAEQSLILHRLLQPYHCGDVDVGWTKRASSLSKSTASPAAQSAKGTTKPTEPNKQPSESPQHSSKKSSADGEKPGSGQVKKFTVQSKSQTAVKPPPIQKNRVSGKPQAPNRKFATTPAAKWKPQGAGTLKPRSLLDMSMRQPRPPPMNASFSLLGVRPPMNEPMVPRMPGPLLEAPYELLPAPSSVDRMDRAVPTCNPAPSRSMMRMPSPGGYRREPSPPMSNRGSLLGSYPGELEMTGARRDSRPLLSDRLEDPMPKMRRMDDERPPMMRRSPDYDHYPNYMQQQQDRFQSDRRTEEMIGRMPEERGDRQQNVISIFDIDDRLRRQDVEDSGQMGFAGNRMGQERFSSHRNDEEMMAVQRGQQSVHGMGSWDNSRMSEREQPTPYNYRTQEDLRMPPKNRPVPLIDRGGREVRGSVEPRMGSWGDNMASEQREQPVPYDNRMQEDRRMPPKNRPVPSLLDIMDRGSHEFQPDHRQQRMPAMDSAVVRDKGPKRLGRDQQSPSMEDDFKQSAYYQKEPGNMASGRPNIAEHGSPSYGRDRDDRKTWASERSDRFGKFESEDTKSTKLQSNQAPKSSEQSDPVSLLLNLSQLLADKLQRDKAQRGDY